MKKNSLKKIREKKKTLIAEGFSILILLLFIAYVLLKNSDKEMDNIKNSQETEETQMSAEKCFADLALAESYKKDNANNAIYTQRFGADPWVMEYDGKIYVYTTNDIVEYDKDGTVKENTYGLIRTINCVSSEDMVNWTDYGAMEVAGKDGAAKWAANSWAPCAAHKTVDGKEVFYLFFANGGNGICVLTSDSPTGPWTDPLGEPLITRNVPNCEDVVWLFDPAILIDDDGTGYLYFGGGIPDDKFANPGTARVVKLSEDLLSLDGEVIKIDVPYLFEDSGINKIDGKYYYSYCSNFSTDGNSLGLHEGAIQYMVSENPLGPFEYVGELFENPGVFFGLNGNNHHAVFEFKGELYLVYHARTVEKAMGLTGNYRSTHIDKVSFENGKFLPVTGTYEGVEQIKSFNPYKGVQASTMSDNGGITVVRTGSRIYAEAEAGDWIKVSDVDFKSATKSITINVKSEGKTYIKVCVGNKESEEACYIEIPDTNGKYVDIETETDIFSGVQDLFFVFAGNVSFSSWSFAADELVVEEPEPLKDIYGAGLTLGMCLNPTTIGDKYKDAVTKNFSSVTCENEMKADCVLNKSLCLQNVTENQAYVAVDFSACKDIIQYCVDNELRMRYHTLVWHNQTPDWFFYEDYDTSKSLADTETMKKRMENYIHAVVSYFDTNCPELIYTIDVVNEAFNGDGTYKVKETENKWYEIFGSSYVYYAFLYTREALNSSENMKEVTLVYNDYNMLYKEKTVAEGLENIFSEHGADVHDYVDVIGFQGHIDITVDVSKYTSVMKAYSDKGYEIQITELDVGIPKVKTGDEPSREQYIEQGEYIRSLMSAILELKEQDCNISAVTLWGINDSNSWRKDVDGYNAYGLLWSDEMEPKPALRGFALCEDLLFND